MQEAAVTDPVTIETVETIEFREASAADLSITTVALRLYPKMIELLAIDGFDDPDFQLAAQYAHEAALEFLLESTKHDEVLIPE